MGDGAPLVSVVVPAWNAEDTLGETLASAAAQTYRNIEILIVDDGSTDGTASVAEQFCEREPRAHLIQQRNGGVAAARNAGIASARGEFVAPLDSDDLWHPQKIERQMACIRAAGEDVGLVYNWSRIIGEDGTVVAPSWGMRVEGAVLAAHLKLNFIGNGSTSLIRSSIFREFQYSSDLRNAGNEGCEDFLLQLQIASKWRFACVPAFLTAYRLRAGAMSGDFRRMVRSHVQMYRILYEWLPAQYRLEIRRQLGRQLAALAVTEVRRGRISHGLASLGAALRSSAPWAIGETCSRLAWRMRGRMRAGGRLYGRPFGGLTPEES